VSRPVVGGSPRAGRDQPGSVPGSQGQLPCSVSGRSRSPHGPSVCSVPVFIWARPRLKDTVLLRQAYSSGLPGRHLDMQRQSQTHQRLLCVSPDRLVGHDAGNQFRAHTEFFGSQVHLLAGRGVESDQVESQGRPCGRFRPDLRMEREECHVNLGAGRGVKEESSRKDCLEMATRYRAQLEIRCRNVKIWCGPVLPVNRASTRMAEQDGAGPRAGKRDQPGCPVRETERAASTPPDCRHPAGSLKSSAPDLTSPCRTFVCPTYPSSVGVDRHPGP